MTTTGPNSPGTLADDSAVGTLTWSSPSNAASSNDVRTFVAAFSGFATGTGAISHYLKATNFGFAIAADQQIDGILVEIERNCNVNGAGRFTKDSIVKLVIGGTVSGSNLADTATKWPTSDAYASYGGASSLWGLTPTYSDINGSTFGVVLSTTSDDDNFKGGTIASVDHIRITITHSTAAAAGQPTTKRFGGVPFMGAHGSGLQAPVRQWIRRASGLMTPQTTTRIWRPANGVN